MTERLHVDWTRCRGRGLCVELLAHRLAPDEDGYPVARDGGGSRDLVLRPEEREAARDAVAMCPVQALRIVG